MKLIADFKMKNKMTTIMVMTQLFNEEGYAVNVMPIDKEKVQIVITDMEGE